MPGAAGVRYLTLVSKAMQAISERPAHGKRLNRAIVVEAALELVDREGLAALNLRRLGSELGASAMAPYSYFSGKEALIDAMLESAVGGLEAQLDPGDPWDAQVEESMVALHEALSRHPGVAELIAARSEGQRLIELRDALLAAVQRAGLDEPESSDALGVCTTTRPARRSKSSPPRLPL